MRKRLAQTAIVLSFQSQGIMSQRAGRSFTTYVQLKSRRCGGI